MLFLAQFSLPQSSAFSFYVLAVLCIIRCNQLKYVAASAVKLDYRKEEGIIRYKGRFKPEKEKQERLSKKRVVWNSQLEMKDIFTNMTDKKQDLDPLQSNKFCIHPDKEHCFCILSFTLPNFNPFLCSMPKPYSLQNSNTFPIPSGHNHYNDILPYPISYLVKNLFTPNSDLIEYSNIAFVPDPFHVQFHTQ